MSGPVGLAFAVHLHQPIGNFDHVFREHVDEVYRPFLERTAAAGFRPISLHVSGPLLDWLEHHDSALLDAIGREVADGDVELLGSGRWEPVLAALSRADRSYQLTSMNEAIADRFGAAPTGAWLTERVWEQDLAADLARAGIEYTMLDDRHFLAVGHSRDELDRPYCTEADGEALSLLSIDERLRYLIPFEPVSAVDRFFRERHAEGRGTIVLGDDGEKFGGWPGTRAWVYESGWLDRFLAKLEELRGEGVVDLVTTGSAATRDPGGLVYPAAGSYREMEAWALPRNAALELDRLRSVTSVDPDLGFTATEHPALRGGHWKNFHTRYPVSNRMHKIALALSRLCRQRGDPPAARAAIGRAQCNDAYWHGVFGGVYLPHLRQGVWRELAAAEAELRAGESPGATSLDLDFCGHDEIWVHGSRFSAVVSPERGGVIESLLRFESGENDVDMLARQLEAYHGDPGSAPPWSAVREQWEAASTHGSTDDETGTPSIHDVAAIDLPAPPGVDPHPPVLFRDRVRHGRLAGGGNGDHGAPVRYRVERIETYARRVTINLAAESAPFPTRKSLVFGEDGGVECTLEWDVAEGLEDATVAIELWLATTRIITATGHDRESTEDIVTLARSERGYEEILQGRRLVYEWPARAGRAEVRLAAPGGV